MKKTQNPRSPLVSTFNDGFADQIREDDDVETESAIQSLERIESYLRVGRMVEAMDEVERFEGRTGIDFEQLAAGTQSRNIADPRRTN